MKNDKKLRKEFSEYKKELIQNEIKDNQELDKDLDYIQRLQEKKKKIVE